MYAQVVVQEGPRSSSTNGRLSRYVSTLALNIIGAHKLHILGVGELTSLHPHFHPDSPAACEDVDLQTAK